MDLARATLVLIRVHWSIENNLHWVLYTVFDDDYCRVRKDNSAQNLNIIRKLVINLLSGLVLPIATKKKNLTIVNKQTLCSKKEKCLLYALQIYNTFALPKIHLTIAKFLEISILKAGVL